MSELKAIIFDVDGTLADTEGDAHLPAFNQAFSEFGLDWVWDSALYKRLLLVTGGRERLRHYIDNYLPDFSPDNDLDEFIRALHTRKTEIYAERVMQGVIPLRPGVKRLLTEIRQAGLGLAIATTTSPSNVEALLISNLGEQGMEWFDVISAGDVVPNKKPAPDIYYYVLQGLGMTAAEVMAIEDSRNGLLSASGAGIRTIITVDEYTRDQDFTGAAIVLDQLGEPDQPFTVLAGNPGTASYVDLELIRKLYAG